MMIRKNIVRFMTKLSETADTPSRCIANHKLINIYPHN